MRKLMLLAAGACLVHAGAATATDDVQAYASDSTHKFEYLGVLLGYTIADQDRQSIESAIGASVLFGTQYNSGLGFEVQLQHDNFETDVDGFTDFYRTSLGVDGTWSFGDRESFTPFILVGVAGAYNDVAPDSEDEYGWMANVGGGFVTGPLFRDLGVRAELRGVFDDFQEGQFDYRFAVGVTLPLAAEVVTHWKEIETVRVVEVARDTGLYDADGDGVVDNFDRCPETPAGTRVDGNGCTLPEILKLEGVTFEFDKATLTANAKTVLDELVVPLMNRYPDMIVEVAGHTDSKGSDSYNQRLSDQRARSVVDYLTLKGVELHRMTARGYGESAPVADNATDAGRELNRRVELRVKN